MFLSERGLEKSLHDTSVPIVQYSDQNHIIFNTQETDCSLFMTYNVHCKTGSSTAHKSDKIIHVLFVT